MTAAMLSDNLPITAAEARALFAPYAKAPALILAVSGGPDSTALMWLAARWRRGLRKGPKLVVVTVDHGLRRESRREALAVKRLASELGLCHRTKTWRGAKPKTGIPAASRAARYRLLCEAARAEKATHIVTAHTLDDQAETVLMRLARGSGLMGLRAMAEQSPLGAYVLARPLLGIPKARLVATLAKAKIAFASDPGNADPAYLRPRLRELLPALAAEGLDSRSFCRFAARMDRADAAIERMADGAERFLAAKSIDPQACDAGHFLALPEEIRIRLLLRRIDRVGNEGPAELGKIEALQQALAAAGAAGALRRTLAGALVCLSKGRLTIETAPPRRAAIKQPGNPVRRRFARCAN